MNLIALTIDIEWAPDIAIEKISELLIKNEIKATWLLTHDSPKVRDLFKFGELFEFGIHPNFLPGSTHGETEDEVMTHLLKQFPGLSIMRTHALVQSTHILNKCVTRYGVKTDLSLFLPKMPNIIPHKIRFSKKGKELIRIPYFWEDDLYMAESDKSWDISDSTYQVPGLKIFNFHPTYIYMNLDTIGPYERMKGRKKLSDVTHEDMAPFCVNRKKALSSFFLDFIRHLKKNQDKSYKISEIINLSKV